MNRHVNAIAGRLSLRPPQRRSLEILDRITEVVPPRKGADLEAALAVLRSEFPTVTDFEREFPSVCFALATGVGKTRLMGAFISYLHLAYGLNNSFVLAPNLTIYNKLYREFEDRNHLKYVFKGIAEFATDAPEIITGDNYEARANTLFDTLLRCRVNVFNISKINAEVRGGKSPRIKRFKVELETYARETDNPIVKPFLLVIARDTTHAGQLVQLIQSDGFFEGRYRAKVIQVDSSKTGAEEDEMVQRLLAVESAGEPTEIVIHVNMLKEGWDVTNLYTIVPLRAATHGGKPWKYLLIPHDAIAENMTLAVLAGQFAVS